MEYRITHTLAGIDASPEAGDRLVSELSKLAVMHGPVVSTNERTGLVAVTLTIADADGIPAARRAYEMILDALGPDGAAGGRVAGLEVEELGVAAVA